MELQLFFVKKLVHVKWSGDHQLRYKECMYVHPPASEAPQRLAQTSQRLTQASQRLAKASLRLIMASKRLA